jgi:phosphoserine aminotransferase
VLPEPVLERARDELLSFGGSGMSIMEMSHRSAQFKTVLENAVTGVRELLNVPANYQVLFLQGGASLQFSMVPMNLLGSSMHADYVVTGSWGAKAVIEAEKIGRASVIWSGQQGNFTRVPNAEELCFTPGAAYVHYTSNETIHGVEFDRDLEAGGIPVVCDASSNIFSRPVDLNQYSLVYAGAQKNIGPSGLCLVIIREDLLQMAHDRMPSMLDYGLIAKNGSMYNTPNTWAVYIAGLVFDWLREQGGVAAMAERNAVKAQRLYNAIDSSDGFYRGHADRSARSKMNVTFRLPTPELESEFCREAMSHGLDGLKGHRSVGGIRASIYNALPVEGVSALIDLMSEFAARKG